jgi:hypothetical protein
MPKIIDNMTEKIKDILSRKEKIVRYHENGQISEIYNIDRHGRKSGKYLEFDKNGFHKIASHYKNDQLEGDYKKFVSGCKYTLSLHAHYKMGVRHGKYTKYNPEYDRVEYIEFYTNDVLTERHDYSGLDSKFYYSLWEVRKYYPNGNVKYYKEGISPLMYRNYDEEGKPHGIWFSLENGERVYRKFDHGQLIYDSKVEIRKPRLKSNNEIMNMVRGRIKS